MISYNVHADEEVSKQTHLTKCITASEGLVDNHVLLGVCIMPVIFSQDSKSRFTDLAM